MYTGGGLEPLIPIGKRLGKSSTHQHSEENLLMQLTGLTLYEPEKAYHGYTLISPMEGTGTSLRDMRGHIVHRSESCPRLRNT